MLETRWRFENLKMRYFNKDLSSPLLIGLVQCNLPKNSLTSNTISVYHFKKNYFIDLINIFYDF